MSKRTLLIAVSVVFAAAVGWVLLRREEPNTLPPERGVASNYSPPDVARSGDSNSTQSEGPKIEAQEVTSFADLEKRREDRRKARIAQLMEDPRFRELNVRMVTRDYDEFVRSVQLNKEGQDLLHALLVDQQSSVDQVEYDAYNSLIRELIGDTEYERLQEHRRMIPLREQAQAAIDVLKAAHPEAAPEQLHEVQQRMLKIPVNNALNLAAINKRKVTDQDIRLAEETFRNAYRLEIDKIQPPLPREQQQTLDAWYEGQLNLLMWPLRNHRYRERRESGGG